MRGNITLQARGGSLAQTKFGGEPMSEQNKILSAELTQAMDGLPEEIKADFQKRWTEQAIGARIVADMAANQPG